MPLTHVKEYRNGKWVSVSIEEMRVKHAEGGISARSGILMCDLCNKHVIMTSPNILDSYFRHNSADAEKDCPERSTGNGGSAYVLLDKSTKGLPIRIVVKKDSFSFELGFPAISELSHARGKIIIDADKNTFIYSVDRFSPFGMTYLNVGNIPAKNYTLHLGDLAQYFPEKEYWPTMVKGINQKALFLKSTGRMLPLGSDIIVGEEYYYLTRYGLYSRGGIDIKRIQSYRGYTLYEVRINVSDWSTAEFVMDEFEYRLVEASMKITFLWPVVIKDPYLIYHREKTQYAFVTGSDAIYKLYPYSNIPSDKNSKGTLLRLTCFGRQQLLSIGRNRNILDYTYLWFHDFDLEKQYALPDDPYPLQSDDTINYVKGRTLAFIPKFDGFLTAERNGWIEEKYELKAGVLFELNRFSKSTVFKIYYGCDLIWQSIRKPESGKDNVSYQDDEDFLLQLARCRGSIMNTPEAAKSIAKNMNDLPLSKKWLVKRIRDGSINSDAYKLLMKMKIERR